MRVRPFDIETDLFPVLEMGKRMHGESVLSALAFDTNKVVELLSTADSESSYFFHVVEDEGIAGFIIAVMGEHFCSRDLYSVDLCFWVEPDYRGTPAASMLIGSYKEWAFERGVSLPLIGDMSGINPELTSKFLSGLGFQPIGSNFIVR